MQVVIGMCGFIGSGKSTAADSLVKEHGFYQISFADPLKDMLSILCGWDRAALDGLNEESRNWREQTDSFWSKELDLDVTPRMMMQLFGTECMRKNLHENIWVSHAKKKILDNPDKNYVIADVRFLNEIKMIREINGKIFRLDRWELPSWYNHAISDNYNGTNLMCSYPDVHDSEWKWVGPDEKFDAIIDNKTTIEEFQKKISAVAFNVIRNSK